MTPEPKIKQRPEPPLNSTHPQSPKKTGRPWLVAALALLLAGGLFVRSRRASAPAATANSADSASAKGDDPAKSADPIPVEVLPAALGPVEQVVTAQGTLIAAQGASAKVASVAPGRLQSVLVAEGDRVSAGQLLAVVDNRTAAAGAQSAQAALVASQADAQSARLAIRAAQTDQINVLRQAQLGLSSAITEREGALRQAQIALRSAQTDLRKTQVGARATDITNALQQARLALRAARIERDSSIKAARNALRSAQTDLSKLHAGARPQEVRQAQAAVSQAQATRDRAATEVDRVQFLFDRGIKAKRELDDAQTALRVAEAGLKSAQNALSLVQAGSRVEDIQAGELRVSGAREAVSAAQSSGDAKVFQAQSALQLAQSNLGQASLSRPEDVRAARLRVSAAQDALRQSQANGDAKVAGARAALQAASQGAVNIAAKAQDARSKQALALSKAADLQSAQVTASSAQIRAPLAGVVTKRNLNPGDLADPATPVVEIANTNALNLLANLSGGKGAQVTAGMIARVSTSEAPGRVFLGRVQSVGQIDPQTNLLSVRIAVPNPNGQLKVGAFALASIVVATKPLVVVIPTSEILSRDAQKVVLVAGSDGKAHQKTVTTGIESKGQTEITGGLKAGERVIGAGGYQLDDGTAIKIVPKGTAADSSGTATSEAGSGQGASGATGTSEAGSSQGAAGAGSATGAGGATGTSGTAGAAASAGGAPGA